MVHYRCFRQQEATGGLIHGDFFAAILRCSCRHEAIPHKLWPDIPWETSAMSPGHKPTSPFPYLGLYDGDYASCIPHMPEAVLLGLLNVLQGYR